MNEAGFRIFAKYIVRNPDADSFILHAIHSVMDESGGHIDPNDILDWLRMWQILRESKLATENTWDNQGPHP